MNSIAKTAGVGPGTLYRHFPNRDALIIEVYRREIQDLVDQAPLLLAEHQPVEALRLWFISLAEALKTKHGLGEAFSSGPAKDRMTTESYAPVTGAMRELITAGQRSQDLRADLDVDDVLLLVGCLWRVGPGPQGREQGDRLLGLILDGLRAPV